MLWIVAYDVADDRRRARVHRYLTAQGIRTQKSLFVCDLSARQVDVLCAGLEERIDPAEDQVRLYPLCAHCAAATVTHGANARLEDHGGFLVT